jgi:hypothetical protein
MRRFRSEVRPELTWIGRPSIYGQLEDEEYRRQKILDDEKKRQKEESDK